MLNRIELIGRLGADPKFTPENGDKKAYASVSIATTDKYNGTETTEWNNITAFGRLAEILAQFAHKGTMVYVAGKLVTHNYTDRNGVDRSVKNIILNELNLLGSKSDNENEQSPAPKQAKTKAKRSEPETDNTVFDDVPF